MKLSDINIPIAELLLSPRIVAELEARITALIDREKAAAVAVLTRKLGKRSGDYAKPEPPVSSAASDLAACRAALVKMADGVCHRDSLGRWYTIAGPTSGAYVDKIKLISDLCEDAGCPISPAEIDGILGATP
jgi:hypothetical protein